MPKINLKKVTDNLATVDFYIKTYPDRNFPKQVADHMIQLLKDSDQALYPDADPPPSLTPLIGKSLYYSTSDMRKLEIQAGQGMINKEGAYTYLLTALDDQIKKNPENLALILFKELLIQNPQLIDLRGLPMVQESYRLAFNAHRQTVYNDLAVKDWANIVCEYEDSNQFFIDCEEFKVYPVALDIFTNLEHKRFKVKPTQQPNIARVFDVEEEKLAKETEREVNSNPFTRISVGNLHSMQWNIEVYNSKVEAIYQSFKNGIILQLEDFKRKHGGDVTRSLILEKNAVRYKLLSDEIMLGFRIEFKPQENKEDKKQGFKQKFSQIVKGS